MIGNPREFSVNIGKSELSVKKLMKENDRPFVVRIDRRSSTYWNSLEKCELEVDAKIKFNDKFTTATGQPTATTSTKPIPITSKRSFSRSPSPFDNGYISSILNRKSNKSTDEKDTKIKDCKVNTETVNKLDL